MTTPDPQRPAGFRVGHTIATNRDTINDDGTLAIDYIQIEMTVKYPTGMDIKPYAEAIEKGMVAVLPAAYLELGRRAG